MPLTTQPPFHFPILSLEMPVRTLRNFNFDVPSPRQRNRFRLKPNALATGQFAQSESHYARICGRGKRI
jgi:hypothetical protein